MMGIEELIWRNQEKNKGFGKWDGLALMIDSQKRKVIIDALLWASLCLSNANSEKGNLGLGYGHHHISYNVKRRDALGYFSGKK